jgi:hypothetical protein
MRNLFVFLILASVLCASSANATSSNPSTDVDVTVSPSIKAEGGDGGNAVATGGSAKAEGGDATALGVGIGQGGDGGQGGKGGNADADSVSVSGAKSDADATAVSVSGSKSDADSKSTSGAVAGVVAPISIVDNSKYEATTSAPNAPGASAAVDNICGNVTGVSASGGVFGGGVSKPSFECHVHKHLLFQSAHEGEPSAFLELGIFWITALPQAAFAIVF